MKQQLGMADSTQKIEYCPLAANKIDYIGWSGEAYFLSNGNFSHWGRQNWTVKMLGQNREYTYITPGIIDATEEPSENSKDKDLCLAIHINNNDSLAVLRPLAGGYGSLLSDYPGSIGTATQKIESQIPCILLVSQMPGHISSSSFLLFSERREWIYNIYTEDDYHEEIPVTGHFIKFSTDMIGPPFNFVSN